jgi:putative addiction module CopG family antidote
MRAVMNISLPEQMAAFIDSEVESLNFSSRSEFIRNLIRNWQNERAVKQILKSKKDTDNGNYKILNSLSDLD